MQFIKYMKYMNYVMLTEKKNFLEKCYSNYIHVFIFLLIVFSIKIMYYEKVYILTYELCMLFNKSLLQN